MDDETNDPNNDPEFVSLFTLSDSDEESESDEDLFVHPSKTKLQPTENPYDRSTRVQQANRELFSQPHVKKKVKSKVQFDLAPQDVNGEGGGEGGDGDESVNGESNPHQQIQRRDPGKVVLLPRRYSGLHHHFINSDPTHLHTHHPREPHPTRTQYSVTGNNRELNSQNQTKEENSSTENSQNHNPPSQPPTPNSQ